MENVNTSLEDLFNTLFPMNNINPEEVIKEVEKVTAKGLAEPLARLQPTQWR